MSVQVSATFNGAEETFCAETIPLTPSTLAIPPFHMHTVRDNCHFSLCLPITSPSSLPPSLPNSLSPTYSLQRSVGFCGGRAILTRPRGSGFQRQESCRILPHRIAKRVRPETRDCLHVTESCAPQNRNFPITRHKTSPDRKAIRP